MKYNCATPSWAILIAAIMIGPVTAESVTTLADIENWVGLGDRQAGLVIDWNDGQEPQLWGYRFNGTKSGQDMFFEIVGARAELFARVGPDGPFGRPIYGVGLDRNGGEFGISDEIGDESAIFLGSTIAETPVPDEFDNAASSNDPGDSYQEGWFTGYWTYWNSTGQSANRGWGSAATGAADRILSDGDWDGIRFDPTFSFLDPPAVTLSVPEPSAVAMLCAVCLTMLTRRQRD